jgi:hypothetical protein
MLAEDRDRTRMFGMPDRAAGKGEGITGQAGQTCRTGRQNRQAGQAGITGRQNRQGGHASTADWILS